MKPPPEGYEVYGGTSDDVYVIAERDGGVVAAFYALESSPGWWRGHAFGRVRQLYLPGAEPLTVAERFVHR